MTTLKKPLRRVSNDRLDGTFGADRERRITVTLRPGNGTTTRDLIELRPERTRRSETVALIDVYRYALRCRINAAQLEKARQNKEAKARRLAARRQARAEKRLVER